METRRQYQLHRAADDAATLALVDAPVRPPGDHEVLVRVHAASINRRDIYVRLGRYPGPKPATLVPLSDGAGEVVETGARVTRLRTGDRVAAIFFPQWLDGRPRPEYLAGALGGGVDGMLSEYVTLDEHAWVNCRIT